MSEKLFSVRQAESFDTHELVRLRHAMFRAMSASGAAGRPEEVEDDSWYQAAEGALVDGTDRGTLAAFVIDAVEPPPRGDATSERKLIACAIATLDVRLPGPGFPRGLSGSISSVFVEPAHRGRGLARAVVSACLAWLDAKHVEVIDIHATPDAEQLYRSAGFREARSLALRRMALPTSNN
jgi:GNAT superfamily N-acetyltransferase